VQDAPAMGASAVPPFRSGVVASPVPEPVALPLAPSLADAAALGGSPDGLPAAVLSSRRGSIDIALVQPCIGPPQPGAGPESA